jgi:hypothetical protein
VLNIARITAVNGLNTPSNCNQCLEISGDGRSNQQPVYVLAVDQKGDPGLDIARSSYQKLFPDKNWLDPQICNWRVVDSSYCAGICVGTPEECNQGSRNLLPAYLLPKMTSAKNGIDEKVNNKPLAQSLPTPKVAKSKTGNNSSVVSSSKSSASTFSKTAVSSAKNNQTPKVIKQLKNTTMISSTVSIPVTSTRLAKPNSSTVKPSTKTANQPPPSITHPSYYYDGISIRVSSSISAAIHFLSFFVIFLHL